METDSGKSKPDYLLWNEEEIDDREATDWLISLLWPDDERS